MKRWLGWSLLLLALLWSPYLYQEFSRSRPETETDTDHARFLDDYLPSLDEVDAAVVRRSSPSASDDEPAPDVGAATAALEAAEAADDADDDGEAEVEGAPIDLVTQRLSGLQRAFRQEPRDALWAGSAEAQLSRAVAAVEVPRAAPAPAQDAEGDSLEAVDETAGDAEPAAVGDGAEPAAVGDGADDGEGPAVQPPPEDPTPAADGPDDEAEAAADGEAAGGEAGGAGADRELRSVACRRSVCRAEIWVADGSTRMALLMGLNGAYTERILFEPPADPSAAEPIVLYILRRGYDWDSL